MTKRPVCEVPAPDPLQRGLADPWATWFNIVFSFDALTHLANNASDFTDQAFKNGLAKRSLQAILSDSINAQTSKNQK